MQAATWHLCWREINVGCRIRILHTTLSCRDWHNQGGKLVVRVTAIKVFSR